MALQHDCVVVDAPARLHLGFIDLSGATGRKFGSVGLALEEISTRVRARCAPGFALSGEEGPRAQKHFGALRKHYKWQRGCHVAIEQAIAAHSGLGSGTQLALALGTAVVRLYGEHTSARQIADLLDRGNRSGIGLGAFEYGGFLVDGGRGTLRGAPPIVSRLHFPDDWRVILLFDPNAHGLHGANEARAFRELAAFPKAQAQELAHEVLLRALPAVAEKNLTEFGAAINRLQQVIGDYFAPAQGGRYLSARVGTALDWMQSEGAPCVGQTSWGPTGFAIVADEAQAKDMLKAGARRLRGAGLESKVCRARNRGGSIELLPSDALPAPKLDAA